MIETECLCSGFQHMDRLRINETTMIMHTPSWCVEHRQLHIRETRVLLHHRNEIVEIARGIENRTRIEKWVSVKHQSGLRGGSVTSPFVSTPLGDP